MSLFANPKDRFFTCVALGKAGLVVGPLNPSGRPTVRPKHFRVPSLCNLLLQKFSFFFIQTLPNDCSHIEDVHLLFCARFINFFSFLRGVELRHFFPSAMLRECLVCVICNSNSIHSFILKLHLMIVHTLKMCTSYIVHVS